MKKLFRDLGWHGLLVVGMAALLLPAAGIATLDALDLYDLSGGGSAPRAKAPDLTPEPAPAWLDPLNFVAQTVDGHVVTLEVAIDAPDKTTRRALASDTAQLMLLLKLQVGTMPATELKGPGGIERLATRMLNALRDYMGDDADDQLVQVRRVAIGNLVVRRP